MFDSSHYVVSDSSCARFEKNDLRGSAQFPHKKTGRLPAMTMPPGKLILIAEMVWLTRFPTTWIQSSPRVSFAHDGASVSLRPTKELCASRWADNENLTWLGQSNRSWKRPS